jgi:uncharacterized protein (UPF0210 family)
VNDISRRDALSIIAAAVGAAASGASAAAPAASAGSPSAEQAANLFRIRTLTAGTPLKSLGDLHTIESALDFLSGARRRFEAAGFEVQTVRIALNPLLMGMSSAARMDALKDLQALDALVSARGALLSIGPVFGAGETDERIGDWAALLVRQTKAVNFSGSVASQEHGLHRGAIDMAARVIAALTHALPGGLANFRFAAAACVAPGTPFFPVAYAAESASLAVGLETPRLLTQAFTGGGDPLKASDTLRALLDRRLLPVQTLAQQVAAQGNRVYLGIDTSPAPGRDSSIGQALETLTGKPFGAASTLQACAAVTAAIKSVSVKTCGYSGLMLPILEDPVLAQRVIEGSIKIADLLLFSTVCGTGLDLVPLPGDSLPQDLARVIGDMATLAVRLKKPLSARLFPVPGKAAGDPIEFTDPLLCPAKVMPLEV